jgi:hypothetical protein
LKTLHHLSFDFKDIENELFDARIRHDTIVSPMREYIKLWLKNASIKIIELDQQNVVTTVMELVVEHSTKGISTSK